MVNRRTESTRTFDEGNGRLVTEIFSEPIFYQPESADGAFVPIEPGFAAVAGADKAVVSRKAPVVITVAPAGDARGFLAVEDGDGFRVGYRPLVSDGSLDEGRRAAEPVIDKVRADVTEVFPGVKARVFAQPDAAKLFLVLDEAPKVAAWTFQVDLPKGATLRPDPTTGGIDILDVKGDRRIVILTPYAVDSTPDELTGSGRMTPDVHYTIGNQSGSPTVTVSVDDPVWLAEAVYPVYVDPTLYVPGSNAFGDAHVTSGTGQNLNYANYQRPDAPNYYEMWLGESPSDARISYAYFKFNLATLAGQIIDSASIEVHPYHQYYNAPTATNTWLRRVVNAGAWDESTITWNNKPVGNSVETDVTGCVEGSQCAFGVTSLVRGWLDGTYTNNGVRLDENGNGATYWKRLISSEQGTSTWRPRLIVASHTITTTSTTPQFTNAVTWGFADTAGHAQARYEVDIATDAAFTNIVVAASTAGIISSSAKEFAPPAGSLTDLGSYHFRVQAGDSNNMSAWVTGAFTYDASRRGKESYYGAVPFDLSGGWNLEVAMHSGELRLERQLFSIPSYGPPAELSLTYGSLVPGTTARFGTGWTSNLTQYLSFVNGLVIWRRADGGRTAFAGAGSTWTVQGAHYDKLTLSGAEYTVTTPDQTRFVFESSGTGRLKRILNRFGKALTITWTTTTGTATDASGRTTALVLDAGGAVTSATDSAGRAWAFVYTGGNLTRVTDPAGKHTDLVYGSGGLIEVRRDRIPSVGGVPALVRWTIEYTNGKATAVRDPIGLATSGTPTHLFTYNASSTDAALLKTYSPIARNTTTYTLDVLGRPSIIQDPDGYQTKYGRDSKGNALTQDNPIDVGTAAWAQTTRTYDTAGNMTVETVPVDGSNSLTTRLTYSATNDPVTVSENDDQSAMRVITLHKYDASGHLTDTVENCTSTGTTPPSPASTCTGLGTANASTNLRTTYTYNATDQVDVIWNPRGFATKASYDVHGNRTSTIENCTSIGTTVPARGSTCTGSGTANASTNVASTASYNLAMRDGKAGLPQTTSDAVGAVTIHSYDVRGRETTVVLPGDASIPVLTTTIEFDEFDLPLRTTKSWPGIATNRVTTVINDMLGRVTSETDPSGVVSSWVFDAAGNQVSATQDGQTSTSSYDGRGNATTETLGTGPDASTVARAYDGQGVEVETSHAGSVVRRDVDSIARVIGEAYGTTYELAGTDPEANLQVVFGYDLTTTEKVGGVVRSVYTLDRLGRTVSRADGATIPLISTSTHDANGNVVATTAPKPSGVGATTTSTYDALDRETVSVENDVATPSAPDEDRITSTFYDAAGNEIATTDAHGRVTRTFYNLRGLAWRTITNCTDSGATIPADPASCAGTGTASADLNVVTTMAYDGAGDLVSTTRPGATGPTTTTTARDPSGRATVIVADNGGLNLSTEYAFDSLGREVAVKDPRGTITRTFYDTAGRITRSVVNCTSTGTTVPAAWASCTGLGSQDGTFNLTTSLEYDSAGQRAAVVAPNGRRTEYTYDAAGRPRTVIDNAVSTTPGPLEDLVTTNSYDGQGRLAEVSRPTKDRITGTLTRYVHDEYGRVTSEIRHCTWSGFITIGEPCPGTGTRNADTNVEISQAYDDRGNVIRLVEPSAAATTGTSVSMATTQFAYDDLDRLCRVVENATGSTNLQALADPCASPTQTGSTSSTNVSTRYTYDVAGSLLSMIDGNGNTTLYGYDRVGRMTSLTDPVGATLGWVFDAAGNRIRQVNRSEPLVVYSVQWGYDNAGRMTSRAADSVTSSYSFDANGNQLTASFGALTVTATYDRLNRPLTVDDEDSGTTADTTYAYSLTSPSWTDPTGNYTATLDAFSRATSVNDPVNTTDFVWTYRADNQVALAGAPNGNWTEHTYDKIGRLTGMDTDTASTGSGTDRAVYAWTYNRAGLILTEDSTITSDVSNGTTAYAYDELKRLIGASIAGVQTTYGWDKVPNRTSVQIGGTPAATTTFDAASRPTTGTNPTLSFDHDPDGRMTLRTGYQYTWDRLGRLTQVKDGAGNTIATYSYALHQHSACPAR